MGQYYVPIILDENGNIEYYACSHDFNSGLKLMEHSWMENGFVQAFETLLVAEAPRRVVWAGDYADPEEGTVTEDNKYGTNLYGIVPEDLSPYRPDVPILGEKIIKWNDGKPVYGKDSKIIPNAFPFIIPTVESHPYLVNWDKKVYVDKRNVPSFTPAWGNEPWTIHPLPLLTVEGNGRGGGDYWTESGSGNFDLIGSWARDHIILRDKAPEGFEEIKFDLTETR